MSILVNPWFHSSFSSPSLYHFALITDHSALLDYNVTAISDATGDVLERYGDSAFGDVRFMTAAYVTKPASDHAWDLLYKAQFRDIETGFYNYGYRYLSPMLGRWLSRDPIGERGGLNLYGFVMNNVANENDKYGLFPDKVSVGNCSINIYAGHGHFGLTEPIKPKTKTEVPSKVSGGKCSAAAVIACNSGYFVTIDNPILNADGRPFLLPTEDLKIDPFCSYIAKALIAAREHAFERICKTEGCCKRVAINILCGSKDQGGTGRAANECAICSGGYAGYVVDCDELNSRSATTRRVGPDWDYEMSARQFP